jgi:hypothetical protein
MQIKVKYYYSGNSKYFDCGGYMVLNKRRIVKLGENKISDEGIPFYFDDTDFVINYDYNGNKNKTSINRIFTEASYKNSQGEYLAKLTWLQSQKLIWMFNSHWLQQNGNLIQLSLFLVIFSLMFFGMGVLRSLN